MKESMQKPIKNLVIKVKLPEESLTKEQVDNILYYIYGIKDVDYEYTYKIGKPLLRDRHIHNIKIPISFNMPRTLLVGCGL